MILQKLADTYCYQSSNYCSVDGYEIHSFFYFILSLSIDLFALGLLLALIYQSYIQIRRKK